MLGSPPTATMTPPEPPVGCDGTVTCAWVDVIDTVVAWLADTPDSTKTAKRTGSPATNPLPVIVTVSPAQPDDGDTDVTVRWAACTGAGDPTSSAASIITETSSAHRGRRRGWRMGTGDS